MSGVSEKPKNIAKKGTLGILLPGMGAVSTTLIAGVLLARIGKGKPIGSLSQLGRVSITNNGNEESPLIREYLPITDLNDVTFGGWDIFSDNAYCAALNANVLSREILQPIKSELEKIAPMPAVFDKKFVRNLSGENVKYGTSKKDLANQLINDIETFKTDNGCDRLVMCWCGSTEVYYDTAGEEVFSSLEKFDQALEESSELIPPSMLYAYAALCCGVPYANGAPNLSVNIPALCELAERNGVPFAGKDFKTGQTLMKTIVAPGLKTRLLGLEGWYSGNILGNRDGEVLDDPGAFRSKEVTKSSVLDSILEPDLYPELYGDYYHKVRIEYYPPRGDAKEGWDNIDIVGWLEQPMQIKINFLCRDSILAAPVVLDILLFLDIAHQVGEYGIQDWLSFYFKSPLTYNGEEPINDTFVQHEMLLSKLKEFRLRIDTDDGIQLV